MNPRIASLLPSATEIVCLLGREADLVGVSHECDYPPQVIGRAVLTAPRVALPESSAGIDREVRALLHDALAVYEVHVDELERVAPDIIVTQDLCDVCAVSFEDVRRAVAELGSGAEIVNLRPTRLADVWADVRRVGRALGAEAEAERALLEIEARIDAVRRRAQVLASRPAVLTIEWIDPVMIGGTWMPELVELAGGHALVTTPGQHAPTLSRDQLAELDPAPEVVLVKPCGFPLERTLKETEPLRALFASLDWPAVRDGRIWLADGNAYFNRPGPRLVDSLEIMAACLHPEAFPDLARQHAAAIVRFSS